MIIRYQVTRTLQRLFNFQPSNNLMSATQRALGLGRLLPTGRKNIRKWPANDS